MQIISTIINKITNPPTMIPTIAPIERSSANFSPLGAKDTLGDDVTDVVDNICDVVGGGVVVNLEGVTSLTTIINKYNTSHIIIKYSS